MTVGWWGDGKDGETVIPMHGKVVRWEDRRTEEAPRVSQGPSGSPTLNVGPRLLAPRRSAVPSFTRSIYPPPASALPSLSPFRLSALPPSLKHPDRRPIQIVLQRPLDPLSRLNDHTLRVRAPRGADRPPPELDLAGLAEHPTRQQKAGGAGGGGDTDARRLPVP